MGVVKAPVCNTMHEGAAAADLWEDVDLQYADNRCALITSKKEGGYVSVEYERIYWAVGVLLAIVLRSRVLEEPSKSGKQLDAQLVAVLASHGFTGTIESSSRTAGPAD